MGAPRILVLIPHPDDEVVGCATAIARVRAAGAMVFALYLTTGVPPRECLWPWQRRGYDGRVERRRAEAWAVADLLDIDPIGFATRSARTLASDLDGAHAEIGTALRRVAADALWTPAYEGGHQDHDATNVLASTFATDVAVTEYAEYNLAGGRPRTQQFPTSTGREEVLLLTPAETAQKRRALALYASEGPNLAGAGVGVRRECLRPLPRHDYTRPPHPGRPFWARFHWVPFRHPRVDFTPPAAVWAALAAFVAHAPGPSGARPLPADRGARP